MNLGQVKTAVRELAGDDSGIILTDNFITLWANLGQLDIVKKTECLEASYTVAATNATQAYALPAAYLVIKRVTLNSYKLDPITMQEADRLSSNADEQSFLYPAGMNCYYVWNDSIYIAAEQATGNLVVHYIKYPTALDSDEDELSIPRHMHEDLIHRVMAAARTRLDEPDLAAVEALQFDTGLAKSKELDSWQSRESYPAVRLVPGDD